MREHYPWSGLVTVRSLDARTGRELSSATFRNLITDAGLNLVRDALLDGGSARIGYLALGAGDTAPDVSDTQLDDERWRAEVIVRSTPGVGQVETIVYVAPGQANDFTIEEIGWFAGEGATADPDTGTLLARVLHNHDKTALESLQIDRLDTFGESA